MIDWGVGVLGCWGEAAVVFLMDASQVEIGRRVGFYRGEAAVAELALASLY